jgi:hypothetical protein
MRSDCRWWLSLLSNNRDMSCQGWDGWQWAGAAVVEGAIWQSFSGFADAFEFIFLHEKRFEQRDLSRKRSERSRRVTFLIRRRVTINS